ncbi:hypothetical protein AM1H77_04210 [Apilactobacillus micheneri]
MISHNCGISFFFDILNKLCSIIKCLNVVTIILDWIGKSFNNFMDYIQAASYIATAAGMIGLIWAIHKNRQDTKFKKTEKSIKFIDKFMSDINPQIESCKNGYSKEFTKQNIELAKEINQKFKGLNISPSSLLNNNELRMLISIRAKTALGYEKVFYKLEREAMYVNKKMVYKSNIYPISHDSIINFYDKNQDIFSILKMKVYLLSN